MTAQTWNIDPTHTTLGFTVRHMVVAKVHGRFTKFNGSVTLDPNDLSKAAAELTLDAASIDTNVPDRDNHLRSRDFFDVEKFPTATFKSTRVEQAGKDRFRMLGELTMHGVTKEVALDVEFLGQMKDPFGFERVAFSATGTIDRKQFGLNWNKAIEAGGVLVGDKITLGLEVQAVKAQAAAGKAA